MKGTMTIIPADINQPISIVQMNSAPTLAVLKSGVNGLIELIPAFNVYPVDRIEEDGAHPSMKRSVHIDVPCVAFCNEEGKLLELPINERATEAWATALATRLDDVLMGDVIVLTGDDAFMNAL